MSPLLLLLGPPGRQRVSVLMVLLALAIYIVFALVQHAEVMLGFIDLQASNWLTAFNVLGSLGFYLLVRSGWSARISGEPSLMLPQIVHGVLAIVWSYAITGPARGAVLAILVLLLTFGMFALSARQARMLALFALVVLTLTMLWKSQTDPLRYPPWVEAVHLVFSAIVLLGVSALSIRMAALRARLRQLATLDELTGLVNRRHMTTLLKAEQARQQRTGQTMSLVLLDIDHFKQINDRYGHRAGDIVLKEFAQACNRSLRTSDMLARWGGEEFLLMLPDTATEQALLCVNRMRESLAQVSFDAIAPGFQVTFSAGLSTCCAGESLDAAIEGADHAMYRAKAHGRNCNERALLGAGALQQSSK